MVVARLRPEQQRSTFRCELHSLLQPDIELTVGIPRFTPSYPPTLTTTSRTTRTGSSLLRFLPTRVPLAWESM